MKHKYLISLLYSLFLLLSALFAQAQAHKPDQDNDINKNNRSTNTTSALIIRGTLTCLGNITVNSGGELHIDSAGLLQMNKSGAAPSITINSNGGLRISGTDTQQAKLSRTIAGDYLISLNNGSTVSAKYGIIENVGGEKGIYIPSGALVDPVNSFNFCTIKTGTSSIPGSAQMTFENNQNLIMHQPNFIQNGATYNINKPNNAGRILVGASSGNFTGFQFEKDPYNRIDWGGTGMVHSVSIPAGWSGLSSYVLPFSYEITDVVAEIEPQFELLESTDLVYYPSLGINTLVNWAGQSAYKIKMNEAATLNISGYTELDQSFPLLTGWNLTPVICNHTVDAATLFNTLGNSFVVAKEVAGNKIYWPYYGINTIGNLIPGKAYYVKVESPANLQFPENSINPLNAGSIDMESDAIFSWGLPKYSASSHVIAIVPEALKTLQTGDILGAFTSEGICAGLTEIKSLNSSLPLTAFSDDPLTVEKVGFNDGEPILIKVFRPSAGKTYNVSAIYDQHLPDSYLFVSEGLSAITSIETIELSVDENGNNIDNVQIFPNPAEEIIYITGNERFNRLEILDLNNKPLLNLEINPGSSSQINISQLPSGLYMIRFTSGERSVIKKLIIN